MTLCRQLCMGRITTVVRSAKQGSLIWITSAQDDYPLRELTFGVKGLNAFTRCALIRVLRKLNECLSQTHAGHYQPSQPCEVCKASKSEPPTLPAFDQCHSGLWTLTSACLTIPTVSIVLWDSFFWGLHPSHGACGTGDVSRSHVPTSVLGTFLWKGRWQASKSFPLFNGITDSDDRGQSLW